MLALALAGLGCAASVEAPAARPGKAHPEKPFLAEPLAGFPRGVLPERGRRLRAGHAALVVAGDDGLAEQEARALLEEDPRFEPALVLLGQVELATGRPSSAVERLAPIVEAYPTYLAARLALGRAAEKIEDVVTAFESYFEVSSQSAPAAERAAVLRERALEIVARRVDDALRRGRADDAARGVLSLARWAPGEVVTLEAARLLAHSVGDREGEMKALRALAPLRPEDTGIKVRLGELELEDGDPSAGLRIFQELARESPDDVSLAEKLARAKFQWRLTLLPAKIEELVRQPQLTRADFAAVMYWLFPVVRYGRTDSGRIANDILDNPHRQEIVRVVNLGLAKVDRTLHTFGPDVPQTRARALASLLRLLGLQTPRLSCLGPEGTLQALSEAQVCELAARCRLIEEPAACLPDAVLSGPAGFEMSRSALGQLGIE